MTTTNPNAHCAVDQPVGIFDSGLGGISVANAVAEVLPNESLIYVADSKYAPYGEQSADAIEQRCFAVCDYLIAQGVKAIVVACNTATAAAAESLRKHYSVPIVAMEPAVKLAAQLSQNKRIAVLATRHTIGSQRLRSLLDEHAANHTMILQECPGWVEWLESTERDNEKIEALLLQHLHSSIKADVDTVVLGCTHYTFLKPQIQMQFDRAKLTVNIIDTSEAVAKRLQFIMAEATLLSDQKVVKPEDSQYRFISNQIEHPLARLQRMWQPPFKVEIERL